MTRIALAQVNTIVGAFDHNREKILAGARRARDEGADIVLFPELVLTGYPPLDLLERPSFVERAMREEERIIDALPEGLMVIFGNLARRPVPPTYGRALMNTAVVCERGVLVARMVKTLLPTYDVFDEARHFESGGDAYKNVITCGATRIGVSICEDMWNDDDLWESEDMWRDKSPGQYRLYPVDPIAQVMESRPKVLINISASPWARGKRAVRRDIVSNAARKHRVLTCYCNAVGANDGLIFDGTSMVFDSDGEQRLRMRSWEEDFAVIDTEALPEVVDEALQEPMEGVRDALVLGVRDYFRKVGLERAVVGLSGGIDSAVTAYIATEALGPKNVIGVAMPSQYSSEHSITDAEALAENLGLDFHIIPITPAFGTMLDLLAPAFGGKGPDVTEENLQARLRGVILMAMANKHNGVVLATGNKSETAIGYCTLYGDTNGALAVLGDLYKHQVYAIARLANRDRERIPTSSIAKAPSAELAPGQRDEDSLPPYAVLDAMLELFIEHRASAEEIAEKVGVSSDLAAGIIRKVYENEFKRKQLAPTLRVSRKAWTGRFYPIVQRFTE